MGNSPSVVPSRTESADIDAVDVDAFDSIGTSAVVYSDVDALRDSVKQFIFVSLGLMEKPKTNEFFQSNIKLSSERITHLRKVFDELNL